jgi:NCS1 family nucleobase:cation symporter-1
VSRDEAQALIELNLELPEGPLVSADLAPTTIRQRTWNLWHIASLWVGMSVCIPTYMLASSMIDGGMTWRQSLLAVVLGNAIVLVPMIITAHAGTRYGIPFPVFARAAFGPRGAHLPSLLRSVIACGWFGIQTWVGGLAINAFIGILWPGWQTIGGDLQFMGYGVPAYLSFVLFWLINLYFVWAGTESIKWLETFSAPILLLLGISLLLWASSRVGGLGTLLSEADALERARDPLPATQFVRTLFIPWLTAMVGYWATLSLNIPDFTRYARSQRDQALGQALGLMTTMPMFAFVGVAVTSATVILYGQAIWNPVDLLSRLTAESGNALVGLVAMLAIVVATITTNIAANIVAPANSFANLAPRRISFRLGGLCAGIIGILILPWKLIDMYQAWLISYSGLLGAVAGVLICDYVVLRRGALKLHDLYTETGMYAYTRGVNWNAVAAAVGGMVVALAGTIDTRLRFLFDGAWFSAGIVSFVLYLGLMKSTRAMSKGAS